MVVTLAFAAHGHSHTECAPLSLSMVITYVENASGREGSGEDPGEMGELFICGETSCDSRGRELVENDVMSIEHCIPGMMYDR